MQKFNSAVKIDSKSILDMESNSMSNQFEKYKDLNSYADNSSFISLGNPMNDPHKQLIAPPALGLGDLKPPTTNNGAINTTFTPANKPTTSKPNKPTIPITPNKPTTPITPTPTPKPEGPTYTTSKEFLDAMGKGPLDPTGNDKINTGMGSEAATDTKYSWDKKAEERAELSYKSDVLTAKQEALAKRQELETQAQQYQVQHDMAKYSANQDIEKAGWAGGYVLDANRQREYLQQSIQASMYNSMELQKYGYSSQLAAARLAYDSNMMDLAMDYYNQAVQNAINESQQTGVYMSAEQKDMLSQWSTAQAILKDSSYAEDSDEKKKAGKLAQQIESWFNEQNISPAGVKTLGMISAELEKKAQETAMYQATLNSIDEADRHHIFIKDDADGNFTFNNGKAETIDILNASADDIAQYLQNSKSGKENINAFLSQSIKDIITDYASSLEEGEEPTKEGLAKYFDENTELSQFIKRMQEAKGEDGSAFDILDYINHDKDGNISLTHTVGGHRYSVSVSKDGTFKWVTDNDGNKKPENPGGINIDGDSEDKNTTTTEKTNWYWESGVNKSGSLNNIFRVSDSGAYYGLNTDHVAKGEKESFRISVNSIFFQARILAEHPDFNSKSEEEKKSILQQYTMNTEYDDDGYYVETSGKAIKESNDKKLWKQLDDMSGGSNPGDVVYIANGKQEGKLYVCGNNGVWQEVVGNGSGSAFNASTSGSSGTFSELMTILSGREGKEDDGGCFTGDTKILTTTGYVKISKLNKKFFNNVLCVDHFRQNTAPLFTDAKAMFVYKSQKVCVPVIKLTFRHDDGHKSKLSIVQTHALFSKDKNEYVVITPATYHKYIGREFLTPRDGEIHSATLIKASHKYKRVSMYNIASEKHLNVIANDMLTILSEPIGLFNQFEFDQTLRYIHVQDDVKKYGLLEKDEVPNLPQKIYDDWNAKYAKVGIAKGLTSLNKLLMLAGVYIGDSYAQYLNENSDQEK